MKDHRVLSGMRPTGRLHLGHYHGVLKNWIELQNEYDSYFFVADWHAFTTHYSDKIDLEKNVCEMVVDWLAAGINPNTSTIFVQSKVPEHAELHLLLSMSTPLSWLERVPSYKDQQLQLKTKDLATYGFLGYPLLQSADILIYKAGLVPVGEDQVAHVELTREVARRFNYVYGREADFEEKAETAASKMGKKQAKLYRSLRKSYQETGDDEALIKAKALLGEQQNITLGDRERLLGYIEGVGKIILPEPESLLTKASKMPGLDGQKMSKSYNNTISLRDDPAEVEQKIKRMPTDPARVKLTDPGDPSKCPVWQLHEVYSVQDTLDWVVEGCTKAKIGCIECKTPLIKSVVDELGPMQERIAKYQSDPNLIQEIIFEGSERARVVAKETMEDVRDAMGLTY
jgi:tryptophanyl-tRNA synthetase